MRVPHPVQLPLDAVGSGQPVVRIPKAVQVVVVVVVFAAVLVRGVPHDVSMGVTFSPWTTTRYSYFWAMPTSFAHSSP